MAGGRAFAPFTHALSSSQILGAAAPTETEQLRQGPASQPATGGIARECHLALPTCRLHPGEATSSPRRGRRSEYRRRAARSCATWRTCRPSRPRQGRGMFTGRTMRRAQCAGSRARDRGATGHHARVRLLSPRVRKSESQDGWAATAGRCSSRQVLRERGGWCWSERRATFPCGSAASSCSGTTLAR